MVLEVAAGIVIGLFAFIFICIYIHVVIMAIYAVIILMVLSFGAIILTFIASDLLTKPLDFSEYAIEPENPNLLGSNWTAKRDREDIPFAIGKSNK